MDTPIQIEERLWDYIDGLGSPEERSAIQILIAENIEWQHKYKELLNIHQMMNDAELEAPSMRFTKNVMEEIARHHVAPATKTYINKNIILPDLDRWIPGLLPGTVQVVRAVDLH